MLKQIVCSSLLAATLSAPIVSANELKFFIPFQETRPEAKLTSAFMAKATELSGEAVSFNSFYLGGLGFDVPDLLRHLKKGTVDAGLVYGSYYSRDAKVLANMFVDGVALKADDIKEYIPEIRAQYAKTMKKWGIETIGYVQPFIVDHSFFCKEPVTSLEQLKSKKVRVWSKHQLESLSSLGVAAQIVPQADLYVALQTGVVDCALNFGEIVVPTSMHEVAKYETYLLPFISIPAAIGVNKKVWASLDKNEQKALLEAGQFITEYSMTESLKFGNNKTALRQARVDKGVVITEGFSDEDMDAFINAFRVTWKTMAEEAGGESLKVYKKIQKLM